MFKSKKKPTILVLDDDTSVAQTLKLILEKKEYVITLFGKPDLALEELKTKPFDLIISDLNMPEMTGIQFMERVKSIRPDIPVILVTGYPTVDTAVTSMQWGAFYYLRKPFHVKKIYEVVEKALASSNPP